MDIVARLLSSHRSEAFAWPLGIHLYGHDTALGSPGVLIRAQRDHHVLDCGDTFDPTE